MSDWFAKLERLFSQYERGILTLEELKQGMVLLIVEWTSEVQEETKREAAK